MGESNVEVILIILFSASFAGNLVGNSIICYTILQKRSLRTTMNILFVNLSIADMTVGLFMSTRFVFINLFDHPTGTQGMLLCTFLTGGTLMWCGGVVSLSTLLSISIERYYAIVYPYSYRGRLSIRKARVIIFMSWLFGILWVLPRMLTRTYNKEKKFCVGQWAEVWHLKVYSLCWILIAVIIPLCVMAIIYPKIIKTLWITGNKVVDMAQRVRMRSRKRLTKIIIAVTVIYCCCWIPVTVFYSTSSFIPSLEAGSMWHKVGILMVTINSSINPVLYSYQSNQLKKHIKITIKKLLCCFFWVGRGRIGAIDFQDGELVLERPRIFVINQSVLTSRLT